MGEMVKIDFNPHASALASEVRHRRIIRCATEAFLSNGYAATAVEDIAIQANVGKPTIYRLFKDKFGLATAVMRELASDMQRACQSAVDMDAEPEECFVKLGVTYIRWMMENVGKTHHFAYLRLLMEMSGPYPEFAQEWREAGGNATAVPLTKYIEKRQQSGEMLGFDASFIASQFIGSVYHTAQSIVSENEFNRSIDLTRKKVQLFLRGCL